MLRNLVVSSFEWFLKLWACFPWWRCKQHLLASFHSTLPSWASPIQLIYREIIHTWYHIHDNFLVKMKYLKHSEKSLFKFHFNTRWSYYCANYIRSSQTQGKKNNSQKYLFPMKKHSRPEKYQPQYLEIKLSTLWLFAIVNTFVASLIIWKWHICHLRLWKFAH